MATPIEFKNAFIEPLTKLGGWTFNDEQEKFLYERLGRKTTSDLAKAAASTVEKCKKKPTLAELIDSFPQEYYGVPKVESGDDKPNYKPYPAKFIREVVQPAMQEYATGMDIVSWNFAFKEATVTWERENHSVTEYTPSDGDYRYSEAYFANIMKSLVGGMARNSFSQQNRKKFA